MARQRKIVSDFKMVKSHLSFGVLEHALDMPSAEGYVEQNFGGCIAGGVG